MNVYENIKSEKNRILHNYIIKSLKYTKLSINYTLLTPWLLFSQMKLAAVSVIDSAAKALTTIVAINVEVLLNRVLYTVDANPMLIVEFYYVLPNNNNITGAVAGTIAVSKILCYAIIIDDCYLIFSDL